jgi:hypothetical protein
MSISGYLSKNVPDLKMPKTETGTDDLGIRYEGPVLSGLLGVRQNLKQNAVNSPHTSSQIREIAPGGVNYLELPPSIHLREDTRLQPDPLLAAQRDDVGPREAYDPVLRSHLNLPPLPDPHQQRRRSAERWEKERHNHVIS